VIGLLLFWSLFYHTHYDKPWEAKSNVARDISNDYALGEGEKVFKHLIKNTFAQFHIANITSPNTSFFTPLIPGSPAFRLILL
jgi:hypothetical protein